MRTSVGNTPSHAALRGGLFAFFASLYLLGASGMVRDNHDSLLVFGVALNLVHAGSFAVDPQVERILPPHHRNYAHLRGPDGRLFFPKGMSYSLLLVPLVALGERLGRWADLPPPMDALAMAMLLSTAAGPLLTAAQCVVLFETALALGFRRRTALVTTLVAGLGTMLWSDSRGNGLEPLHGLMIALAFYGAVRFVRSGAAAWAALVGAAQAVLVLSQPAMIVLVVPAVTAYMVAAATRPAGGAAVRRLRCAVAYAAPLALAAASLAGLNAFRYGRFAATGYEWQAGRFAIPLYEGAYGLLFSAGKSLFLYSPPLLVALARWRAFPQRVGWLGTLPLALLAVFLFVYGQFAYWSGDGAWGPRYLVPLTGPLALTLAAVLEPPAGNGAARRVGAGLLGAAALGAAVQVVGVATSTWLYFKLLIDAGVVGGIPEVRAWAPVLFEPRFSPVAGRARLLASVKVEWPAAKRCRGTCRSTGCRTASRSSLR